MGEGEGRKEKKSNSKEKFFRLLFRASAISCFNMLYMKILQPSCNHVGKVGGTAKVYSQSDIDLLGGGEEGDPA